MTRARSITAIFAGALAWAAVTACNQQTIQTPLRSFDRPSDIALTCAHFDPTSGKFNVRELSDCAPLKAASLATPASTTLASDYIAPLGPNPPYTPFLMALVTQSARGELALVDAAQNKTVDADLLKPGFGFLPVGKLPEHVRTTRDGCLAVTSNTDSCDYGVVDVATMINRSQRTDVTDMGAAPVATDVAVGVRRIRPTVKVGTDADGKDVLRTLTARPSWIEMAPESDGAPSTHGFESGGTPGQCMGGVHKAWVALPGCQLVVKMQVDQDPARANIEKAIRVTQSGATEVTDLTTLDCPVECVGDALDMGGSLSPPPDLAGAPSDMGQPTATQAFPGTLAVDVETDATGEFAGGRLIIGDLHSERIDIIPFSSSGGALGTARSVQLEHGAQGVRVVRAGPRSEAGKFLYAIARDGTIRVVDLDRVVECETNPDPRFAGSELNLQQTPTSTPPLPDNPTTGARRLGCFPLGDPSTPRRAPLATSPGISLAVGQLPADVAFVHLDAPPQQVASSVAPTAAGPGLLVGDFAWIVTSDGKGILVNIFDACPAPNQQDELAPNGPFTSVCDPRNIAISNLQTRVKYGHPEAMLLDRVSHRLRPGHPRFATPPTPSDSIGQPRVPDPYNPCAVAVPATSVSNVGDGGVPDAGITDCLTSNTLPGLADEPVPNELFTTDTTISHQELVSTRVIKFVDPDRVSNETWVASWEGTLPGSDRALGDAFIAKGTHPDDAGKDVGYVSDPGGSWCYRGARAGDKLIFRGCSVDSECNQAGSFKCVRDPGAFSDVQQGMCLHVDDKEVAESWPGRCGKLLRSQRKFRVGHAQQGAAIPGGSGTTDLLTLQEIYEPEYRAEGLPNDADCKADSDCVDINVVPSVGGAARPTKCLDDYGGRKRCLLPCSDPNSDNECGHDFECYASQMGGTRCMRAPIDATLWSTCMSQLQSYELHVGEAFAITGTGSGHLVSEVPGPDNECIVTPQSSEAVRLRQSRVPLSTPITCTGSPLQSIDPAQLGQTNICMIDSDAAMNRVIHFENPLFNIAVRIPKQRGRPIIPSDGTTVSFQITGGGQRLLTLLGIDVEAQQPRAVVTAPDGQTLYIVDEGKSTSPAGLRGQLLRLFSPTQAIDNQFVIR